MLTFRVNEFMLLAMAFLVNKRPKKTSVFFRDEQLPETETVCSLTYGAAGT